MGEGMNTEDLRTLLRRRHDPMEWALLEEVSSRRGRRADAVAVNLWPSRGHVVHGFEIKAHRNDWLRELKTPQKAEESVFGYCDHWWIVASKGIVLAGELPDGWGLLEPKGGGLQAVEPARRLTAKPVDRAFFASLIRRANDSLGARARAMVTDQLEEARRSNQETIDEAVNRRTRDYQRLQGQLEKLEQVTGLKVDEWDGPPADLIALAQRLQRLDGYGRDRFLGELVSLADRLEHAAGLLRAVRAPVEATG